MHKSRLVATLILGLLGIVAHVDRAAADIELTTLEMKWLRAGWPVLSYAEQQQMPVDIVVQPEANGAAPLAASVADGRCQLVLSMRSGEGVGGDVESILASLPVELHATAIEAMTAHELAHCWRYLNGMWHTVPANFVGEAAADARSERAALLQNMRQTRREEGFADLVGLAWTLRAHPQQYAAIHAWFEQVRAEQPMTGSFHDTRVWLRLAAQPSAFAPAATPFEQARQVWSRGLTQQ